VNILKVLKKEHGFTPLAEQKRKVNIMKVKKKAPGKVNT
jgi:hypothetical protein